jgi:regulator of sigma E protease
MDQILNWAYVIVAVVLLFGAAVFVHEFGHFWMARRLGMKVEAFAIGFGPKVSSWTRDGIEYSWRWIPAGGFVKLPQMITAEALEGASAQDEVPPAPPHVKILVALAGPLMNAVFAFAVAGVIYFVGLPVPVNPSIIGHVPPDSPEAKLGIREGDRIVEVDGKPAESWQEVNMTTALARTNVLPVVIEREGKRSTYHLEAKGSEDISLKMLNLLPRDHPVIQRVLSDGAAAAAGLRKGDIFLTFGGTPVYSQEQLVELIRKRGGQPTQARIEREKKPLALTVTPRVDPTTKKGRIGAELTSSATLVYRLQKPGPTPWAKIQEEWDRTMSTLSALIHSKQTGVGAKDLSGPLGILAMLAAWVNTDYRLALSFLVLLNVNLAVINLLPVPVLDGGHILLSLIEGVRRRPLSARIQEYTTTAFALLLISFMLYVTFFDIKRFALFRSLFQRDTHIEEIQGQPETVPAPGQ